MLALILGAVFAVIFGALILAIILAPDPPDTPGDSHWG